MTGLRLIFANGRASFDTTNAVSGVHCDIQNALVNVTTHAGTSSLYPAQGTSLLRDATWGVLIDKPGANHISNFAAAATLQFLQKTAYAPDVNLEYITRVILYPVYLADRWLTLNASFTSSAGKTYGVTTALVSTPAS